MAGTTETAAESTEEQMQALWDRAEKEAAAAEKVEGDKHKEALAALDGKKPSKELKAGKAATPPAGATPPRGPGGKFQKASNGAPAPAKPDAGKAAEDPTKEKDPEQEPVTVAERVAWREERRQARQKLDQDRAKFGELVTTTRTQLEQQFGQVIEAKKALERDDLDGFAKAIGKGSWKELVKERQAKIMSPEAQRIAELEQREKDREERDRRERQEAEAHVAKRREQAIIGQYKTELSETMATSSDPVVKALAKNQEFRDAVFEVQRANWDGETPLTPEEAVRMKGDGGTSILDTLRASYEALHAAFGDPAAQTQEASEEAPGRSGSAPRGKTKPLPRKGAAEASPPATWKNDQEFIRTWAQRLEQSTPDASDDDND